MIAVPFEMSIFSVSPSKKKNTPRGVAYCCEKLPLRTDLTNQFQRRESRSYMVRTTRRAHNCFGVQAARTITHSYSMQVSHELLTNVQERANLRLIRLPTVPKKNSNALGWHPGSKNASASEVHVHGWEIASASVVRVQRKNH